MTEKRRMMRRVSDRALASLTEDMRNLQQWHERFEPYLDMAIKREARRETFQRAVIEKTAIALVWLMIVGVGTLIVNGAIEHMKTVFAAKQQEKP